MPETLDEAELPPGLRFLQRLVTILTVTMIVGVITVVALLVTRLRQGDAPALPAALTLPAGTAAAAVTMGAGWIAVVTRDDRILIFGTDGTMWQEVAVKRPAS